DAPRRARGRGARVRRHHHRRRQRHRAGDQGGPADGDRVRHVRRARPAHARAEAARGVPRPGPRRPARLLRPGGVRDRFRGPAHDRRGPRRGPRHLAGAPRQARRDGGDPDRSRDDRSRRGRADPGRRDQAPAARPVGPRRRPGRLTARGARAAGGPHARVHRLRSAGMGERGARERWATFDCYGTLIDWMSGIRDTLAELWPEREPEVQRGRRVPYRQVLAETLQRIAHREGLELEADDREALADSLPTWPPFPEVPAALAELRERGWRLAILSNTDPD